MKKLLPILVIFLTSFFLAGEALSLPNCLGTWSSSSWNNCFGQHIWTDAGAKYIGEWKDGEMHGQGTYYYGENTEWAGDRYVGKFRNATRHGQGSYFSADGGKYIGKWKDDKVVEGIETWGKNTQWAGDRYVGEYMDDQFHGQGTYTYADGEKYVGEFRDHQKNGWGTATWLNGEKYVGEWKDGDFHGHGTYTWPDGSLVVGEWKNHNINGQATEIFGKNTEWAGDRYIGEFRDDQFHGQGTYTYADGTILEGIFENNELLYANNYSNNKEILPNCPSDVNAYWHNCFGVYVLTSAEWKGDVYVGEFRDDQFHGQGTYTFLDGDRYVGEFWNDVIQGQGTYTFLDGDRYVGKWRNGEYHGQGTYNFADGTSEEGIFENGEFLYATNDSTDNNNFSNDDKILPASSGSGFAVTSDGHIVTNHHVIDGCQNVEITYKGQTIPSTVISFDLNNDIALLKSDFKPLYTFPLSRKNPYVLMDIYVAGYPFGYDISTPVKITRGIISSLAGIGNNFSQVQIDAAIQPGNSGGPIFDNKGNVVGVAVSKLDLEIMMDSYGVVPEGTNFGIKSNVVINFLESNNISLVNTNTKVLTAEALGRIIPDGTYYISCWMTLAQIEKMRERKVFFSNLK